jgi:hypothetical protein
MGCSAQLAEAKRPACLIGLSRRLEDSKVRGYVPDTGPEFFADAGP